MRCIATAQKKALSSFAFALSSQRRSYGPYLGAGGEGRLPKYTSDFIEKFINNESSDIRRVTPVSTNYAVTGSPLGEVYDEETMFNPAAALKSDAKRDLVNNNSYGSYYTVPTLQSGVSAAALEVFNNFAAQTDQVELLYRKFIRNYPATIFIFGTKAEIEAFEAAEAQKIPNNKLLVGRSSSKGVHYVNIREEFFNFISTTMFMAANSTDAEYIAYATPIAEKFLRDSFFKPSYYLRFLEEVLRSLESMQPKPASAYEIRVLELTLERQMKLLFNGLQDLPWACESFGDPLRQLDVTNYTSRAATEAGCW